VQLDRPKIDFKISELVGPGEFVSQDTLVANRLKSELLVKVVC